MRIEIAIFLISLIAIALKMYVTRFHEGISVDYEISAVAIFVIVSIILVFVLRQIPAINALLKKLERNTGNE
jgi:uncharacterized membrane protein YbhN (UPF0104 family)